jgi:hypothetical protein
MEGTLIIRGHQITSKDLAFIQTIGNGAESSSPESYATSGSGISPTET